MADTKKGFDAGLVESLATILNDTDLTEIEIEQGDMRVRVSREPAPQYINTTAQPSSAPHNPAPSAAPQQAGQAPAHAPTQDDTAQSSGNEVPSPMVGTVYYAPAPGEAPFVTVGDKVKEGDTLVIVEAMKVMNQIPSPASGTLKALLVSDGDPVEYGQPLAVIE
jgi:acetyl-CoA carboxylase biotin carboxyl carrier protein